MPITNTQAENAKPKDKAYRLNDGGALQLEIRPTGGKFWIMRYRNPTTKKPTAYTFGEYPRVTIRQARGLALEAKGLIGRGIDPNTHKQRERARGMGETFRDVALEWHTKQLNSWSDGNAAQVLRCLEVDMFPHIGGRVLADLEPPDLLQVIRRTEGRGALDKAAKVKQRMGAIYRYAVATGRVKYNPVPDLAGAMEAKAGGKHFNALAVADLPAFLRDLSAYRSEVLRRAVQFALLTFARTGSIRAAEWKEIDLENKAWYIPAEHMKMGEAHIIPLSDQAIRLLEELQPFTGDSRLIFYTNHHDKELSPNAMLQVLRRIGWNGQTCIHGFRALASSILHDAGFEPKVIERQLAHAERNKVAGAYNYMAQYLHERAKIMQWWADFIDSQQAGAKVIPLFGNRARGG